MATRSPQIHAGIPHRFNSSEQVVSIAPVTFHQHLLRFSLALFILLVIAGLEGTSLLLAKSDASPDLARHLEAIARLVSPSPMMGIPAGWFIMGTVRKDDDPYGPETQYDDTELPQRRVWLDAYAIDRDEVSIAEYLAYLHRQHRQPPEELQRLSGTSSPSITDRIM